MTNEFRDHWRDVRDEIPSDDREVLVCTQNNRGYRNIVVGYYNPERDRWEAGMNSNVTHWMELPDVPKEEE